MSIRPAVLVVAHPDDEVIGAGALLARLREPFIIQVTNGCPAGYPVEYAAAREAEAARALALARPDPVPRLCLGVTDQQATFEMRALTRRLTDLFAEMRPRFVLTHPYEGGHPDHDATAIAVHLAARRLAARGIKIRIYEFASYHWDRDHLVTGEFLENGPRARAWALSPGQRALKQAMMDAHVSQRDVLKDFGVAVERFRRAPEYDFTAPPHAGRLFYENFNWGTAGPGWRAEAARAITWCTGRRRSSGLRATPRA